MIFGYFTLLVALTISAVAEFYSIVGLTAIFSAAFWPIVIMGASLGVGKVTAAVWLKLNWERASWTYKLYLVPAVAFLMVLTSMGIFGFLSKAHSDQSLVSGDGQAKVAIYDEKINTAKDNIAMARKALKQMDDAVDQVMGRSDDEKGADKAVAIRRGQAKERARLLAEIEVEQKKVAQLSEERAPYAAEFRRIENEVGPIKYIAAFIYGDNPDANILEKAVRFVIILIVAVFDPLALVLILAAQQSIRWAKEEKDEDRSGEITKDTQPSGLEQVTQESTVEEQDAVATAPAADAEPTVQEVTAEPQTTVDPLAYLKQPFVHFENLQPMVHKPEVIEKPEIYAGNPDDFKEPWPEEDKVKLVEAMKTFFDQNKEEKAGEVNEVKAEIIADDGVDEAAFLEQFDENLAKSTVDILTMGIDEVERPGDYLTPPEPEYTGPMKEIVEEYVDPNTRIKTLNHRWVPDLSATADNAPDGTQANADFGTTFPVKATKGDMHVRVDFLPPRLFKFNGVKWMEVDKSMTDSHYSDEYIKHLIDKINSGEYAVEDLSESEQDQIREYLSKNGE
jgi:hypothetical protein